MVDTEPRNIAAIDLGSNSFHMVVAKVVGQTLQLVSRHKQRVRLATGLNDDNHLSEEAMERGLECLAMFAERIGDFDPQNVRIAATHTLRQATNASDFLTRAYEVLPFPIEIIPGEEEARLVYLGVAHTQSESESKFVVDIGGGSTELIIGQGFEAELVNSKQMGCVSFTERFFANGKLNKKNFSQAMLATQQRLESIVPIYKKKGWQMAFGSSGTIKAIREVVVGQGHSDGIITAERLEQLIETLCKFNTIEDIKLEGLSEERQPVFAAGVAILKAVISSLKIEQLHFSDGALREGLLYEMEARFARSDIRMRTTEALAMKHFVDLEHAKNVACVADHFLQQTLDSVDKKNKDELVALLQWAAMLHEVGLSIRLRGLHRHSGYILENANLPGFNQEQQLLLATLARLHRKSIKLNQIPSLSLFKKKDVVHLVRILRLAIIVNGQRNDLTSLPDLSLNIQKNDVWSLSSSQEKWLDDNRLLQADLLEEQQYWQNVGWTLNIDGLCHEEDGLS